MKLYLNNNLVEAGLDESGRGSLIGAVFAAAVVLPYNFYHKLLNDSKKVSKANRNVLRTFIIEHALDFAVEKIDKEEIDANNILQASISAMHACINKLKIKVDFLLIDGNYFKPYKTIQHKCIVKGDALYASIAAASILAKTFRDDYIENLHKELPEYEWNKNKGYATQKHLKLIKEYGLSKYHRLSFKVK